MISRIFCEKYVHSMMMMNKIPQFLNALLCLHIKICLIALMRNLHCIEMISRKNYEYWTSFCTYWCPFLWYHSTVPSLSNPVTSLRPFLNNFFLCVPISNPILLIFSNNFLVHKELRNLSNYCSPYCYTSFSSSFEAFGCSFPISKGFQ